jgi:hypothetical protein
MDANCDGCISWDEFEAFMKNEFAAGQQLLSGEFVLPSGKTPGGNSCQPSWRQLFLLWAFTSGPGHCIIQDTGEPQCNRARTEYMQSKWPTYMMWVCLSAGTALPFGSMIRQLKRNQMLQDVTKVWDNAQGCVQQLQCR